MTPSFVLSAVCLWPRSTGKPPRVYLHQFRPVKLSRRFCGHFYRSESNLKDSSSGSSDTRLTLKVTGVRSGKGVVKRISEKRARSQQVDASNLMIDKDEKQLVHDKITVPDVVPRVSRRRLVDLLSGNLTAYNATVINGRAGTGKSTLAADFARRAGRAVCWYKVEAGDADLRVFCRYLTATLRLQRPSLDSNRLADITESPESDRAEQLAETFVFQLAEQKAEPLLVIIEDLHLVYDAEWVVPFFHRLLPLLPADIHLIITCRSLPPAPLWRMRSKQMLRVIDETELAFTVEEALRLFQTYGLSEEHARVAIRETNGRAAAVATFAATPGLAGRAVADSFLAIEPRQLKGLGHLAPDLIT